MAETFNDKEDFFYIPEDVDVDILDMFFIDSDDYIKKAETSLKALEEDLTNKDAINTIFRAFHSIKGGAGFVKLTIVSAMARYVEIVLYPVRNGETKYTAEYSKIIYKALNIIKQMVQDSKNVALGTHIPKPEGYNDLMHALEKSLS